METIIVVGILFIGLPWVILHYITKWKSAGSLTSTDENMLDEMYDLARKLSDRVETMERIIKLDNPDWKPTPRLTDDDYGTDKGFGSSTLNDRISDRRN